MNILEEIAEKTKERIREEKMQVSISNLLSQIEERKKKPCTGTYISGSTAKRRYVLYL